MTKSALGRGIESLIITNEEKIHIANLRLDQIIPGRFQPRRIFSEEALEELAESIKENGLVQPVIVSQVKNDDSETLYEIISGERRWRACKIAGIQEIPVVIRDDLTDSVKLECAIVENVQREDLSAIEEAESYHRLIEEFGYKQEYIAKIIGKSRSHVANLLRILTLPSQVLALVDSGAISVGHAKVLVSMPDPIVAAEIIIANDLTVRATEALARAEDPKINKKNPTTINEQRLHEEISFVESELQNIFLNRNFSSVIKIKHNAKTSGGTITVSYRGNSELLQIAELLCHEISQS